MRLESLRTKATQTLSCLLAALLCTAAGAVATSPLQTSGKAQQKPANGQQADCTNTNAKNSNKKNDPKCANGPDGAPNDKPAPLFGGSLTIKKSRQTTDNTALGFNGVDPNGQVQQAFLSVSPSEDDARKAQALATYKPTAAELAAFEKGGRLPQGVPTSSETN
jgi:hypothetical protein